ncbi:MAG: hypothetical protein KGD57_05080, partial [Candidatus Lokiarchaeota archaeon]|nr:hypothetical protein [Candidatus Lokiarchaeota archaeon]
MSVPTSMRVGPFVPTILPKKRYITFYIFLFWISLIPILIQFWFYWQILGDINTPVEHKRLTHFYLYLPLFLFIWYVETILISLVFAKILLTIVSFIHKPKEGVFLRDKKNKDYKYWCIRNIIKKWPVWLAHKFPFPFLDNICFKVFGVKTKFSNSLFEGWVDTEFIEFGKNVVIGQGSHIQSSIIMGKFLIIKKTIIENDVRIGVHSVVMPGTHIGEKAVLGTFCLTTIGQKLEEGWIYHGNPAKKFKKNRFFEDGLEKKIKFKVHDEES